ncbi:MAG: hypothetical protein KJ904_18100 [Alphaproteobacteria bacterium]|nr:hypothetical protein [Alphaproteobacteria bacterium]MBU0797500.1 hypothetical protein [Alphaproteobacteria bacterium]MBU0889071.1 hypothetical protein [Alphaproteobacteria bacterium]MBU1813255.1 hypothetical protein [Alphaproteobacteria bacterium]MBU2090946.1 hypothetical protein [Alphaproteobacteria bacterium]
MKHVVKLGLAILGIAVVASTAQAQTTETFTASATVASSLTITQNTALSFGNLVVIQDGTNAAEAVLTAAGTFTTAAQVGTENLVQTGTPTPGNFTVNAGVASFVNLQVEIPNTATTLTNGAAPPGNGTFTVDTFTVAAPTAGGFTGTTTTAAACNTAIAAGNPCQFITSAAGLVTFPLGATIAVTLATSNFIDGTYSGNYDLTASFY